MSGYQGICSTSSFHKQGEPKKVPKRRPTNAVILIGARPQIAGSTNDQCVQGFYEVFFESLVTRILSRRLEKFVQPPLGGSDVHVV